MTVTVTLRDWHSERVQARAIVAVAGAINEAAADGVTIAQTLAPRDTGFMANTIEVIEQATASKPSAVYGNITAVYTLWQEIGARGRPGRYFLRRSLQQASQRLQGRLSGRM